MDKKLDAQFYADPQTPKDHKKMATKGEGFKMMLCYLRRV